MSSTLDSSVKLSKPFSSDTDQEKRGLLQEADLYRDKLELQWDDLKKDATQYGKQALIIGGVVTSTFLVLNALLPDPKNKEVIKEKEKPVLKNKKSFGKKKSNFAVGDAVKSLAWTLAVAWARQKLKNYVADDQKPDENSEP